MIGTIIVAVLILAVGTRATDAVRLRQQEIILAKLPTGDAVAFYRLLRRRAWTVRVLRAVALGSLVVILYARNRAWQAARRDPRHGRVDVHEIGRRIGVCAGSGQMVLAKTI